MRLDSAITLLRLAKSRNPDLYAAQHLYMELMRSQGRRGELAREYPLPGRDALSACLAIVARTPSSYGAVIAFDLLKARRQVGDHPCFSAALIGTASLHAPEENTPALELEYATVAIRYAPQVPPHWTAYAAALAAVRREDEVPAILEGAVTRATHPLIRIPIYFDLAAAFEARGDTARGELIRAALRSAVERDRRPGTELIYLQQLDGHRPPHERRDEQLRRMRRQLLLARRAGAWAYAVSILLGRGSIMLDAGQANGAIAAFDSALSVIPAARRAELAPQLLWRRGRALSKAGRLTEAERDLRQALAGLSSTYEPYLEAELQHNLAHVYESAGRWTEAITHVDRFIAASEPMRTDPMRMMSRRDAGLIRWKAGQHAAAKLAFESMVAIIEQRRQNYYYAGEYYERIGSMQRAAQYYRLGVANDPGERSLNLAGLTRVYESLGLRDSARVAATLHDENIQTPTETPLLPGVLAREGRAPEAIALLRQWFSAQEKAANLAGETLTSLEIARVLLDEGRADEAMMEARRATALAASMHLIEERIEAERLAGLSAFRLGDHAGALTSLTHAARLARGHPTTNATLQTQLALGDVLASSGSWRNALVAYDAAATAAERVSKSLDEDLDQARFRDRHLAPFDGAIRVMPPRAHSPRVAHELLAWSERRKTAQLSEPPRAAVRAGTVTSRRVAQDAALIDYLAIDGKLWAIVSRSHGVQVILLPINTDSLAHLVLMLRDPMMATYAGRLDLARARYDLGIAHELYNAVIAPLVPLLDGVTQLGISPDGALHYMPFDALVVVRPSGDRSEPDYLAAEFMVDRFAITVVTSSSGAPSALPLNARNASVLFVDRGVTGGSRESEAVRRGWRGEVTMLSDARATEAAVWKAAPSYSILHFATHAVANDVDPLASHLVLAPGEGGEGALHAGEITRARWRGRLVVLSACETANGPLLAGQGVMGLARGFLSGGADAVIATLWPIGASSADIMGPLYASLAGGAPTPVALRDAKLALRRQRATSHPFYWASYELIARGRAAM